jgi:hypothetical protein
MPDLLEHRSAMTDSGRLEALLHGDERPARVELRRQIARLETELGELFASAFPRGGIEYSVAPAGGPRMLGITELEQVRDALASRIADVRGVLTEQGYVEERNREFLERVIAEPERYHWVRISNEDIGQPGCRHWHSRPRLGLIGMLMGWWRIKLSSGCPLAKGRRSASRTNKKRWPARASGASAVAAGRRSNSSSALSRSLPRLSRRAAAPRAASRRRRRGGRSRSPS